MTLLQQPCAGSNGTNVSTSNATSGDQWNAVTPTGTGTTITYDNTQTIHGNATAIKLHFPTVAAGAFTGWKASIPSPASNAYARFYIYKTADPSVAGTRISHMMSGLGVSAAAIQITTGGKLRIINSAGTNVVTSTNSIPSNAWARVEWEITGISGSTGTITARFYSGANLDGSTADETITSGAGAAVTGQVNEVRYGNSSTTTQTVAWDLRISDCAWSDTSQPGPIVTASSSAAFLMFM